MEFYEVLRHRRSIRGYKPDPVPAEALKRILTAAQLAPTACNLQPFKFLVVTDPAVRQTICECYPQPWLAAAPVIVVALGNREKAWKRFDRSSAHPLDVAIAFEHLVLAAAAEGLGTCWICAFDAATLHRKLKLADEWDVVALTPLGTPAATPAPQKRKNLAELVETI